jgi:arylsulfatase A-like enzyme
MKASKPTKMKNLVLIITDSFRYDNLSENGECTVRTPELNRFAAERATSIEGFYAGSYPTIPHRTDVATGMLGWPHFGWKAFDPGDPQHIAPILRESGYVSQLICDTMNIFPHCLQVPFDAAYQIRGQEIDRPLLHLNDEIETVVPVEKTRHWPTFRGHTLADMQSWINRYPKNETEQFPPQTAETAVRWLEENYKANPFLLWVDFFDPHEPWTPPEYMVKRYDPDYQGTPMISPNYGPSSAYTQAELKNLWAHYAAESELVDRWIGRILQKIDDLQLWDDTIVIITSDHGISLGEHERTGKSNIHPDDKRHWPIYPEISHVPFLIGGGGIPAGNSLDIFAQPIDILPTFCELAGVSIAPPKAFEGKSFAKSILNGEKEHRQYVVSGYHYDKEKLKTGECKKACLSPFVITKKWGYTPLGAKGEQELYDIVKDPLASNNIAKKHPDVLIEMRKLLQEHLLEHGAAEDFAMIWENIVN